MRKAIVLLFFVLISPLSAQDPEEGRYITIDKGVVNRIAKADPIERDILFEEHINSQILAKGYVEQVEETNRLSKSYCITIADINNSDRIDIRYQIYTDDSDYLEILKKGDVFEFKGKIVCYTPLNSRKGSYIFDVFLEDGALVIE